MAGNVSGVPSQAVSPAALPGALAAGERPAADLPALREELLLHRAPPNHDGSPAWTLEDPGRGLFFQIGWAEAEMLARWRLGSAEAIASAAGKATTLPIGAEDVKDFAQFLQANSLVQMRGPDAIARYGKEADARRSSHWLKSLVHQYLFFRIPLVRPDAFLARTLPMVRRLFLTRTFARLTLAAGLLGLYLAARQWDQFVHTFLHFFTLEGALAAGVTLGAAKVLHELGHAYAAKHHGCRVATMGVAFMVMWPVLYTDSSGAWRLSSRRKRMSIGAAGMLAETALAAWATLAWSFLPDGMLRSAAFTLATTTWLLTLAVNLNPLMRFDGYFLLTDVLNVPNLQNRSFALARWRLREWLFGLGEDKPEVFAPWRERALIIYAFSVWIYRFFLFLGIALLVYHMAFKLLGIVLFAIEIVAFVLRPIYTELRAWRERLLGKPGAGWNRRSRLTACVALLFAIAAVVPWRTRVEAPALLRAANQARIVAPVGAQIQQIAVAPGQAVRAGAPLFVLSAPDMTHEIETLARRIRLLQWQQSFQAMNRVTAGAVPVAVGELHAARERHEVLMRQYDQLTVRAPFGGVIAELAEPLATGEWVGEGEWLASLADPSQAVVEAYVSEEDLHRLQAGGHARFLPEDPGQESIALVISDIAATATRRLSAAPELSSTHGGAVPAMQAPNNSARPDPESQGLVPERAVYRLTLRPADSGNAALPRLQAMRGITVVDGQAESLLLRVWRRGAAIAVRELGF
ncbi:HlyD family efflux transporter periplasmic adaptor subunit [Achromobacter seleniivolatilans]|uniref:HlyD family efflux transporter periplasmic adaptor subunit n=1 Tax=Achromobacter seleniivolatilans TaxID=3047478 RepID=A0ABY9LW15_9BURK|nr:HlyD family efflux transporter periplasmic adaptor subunit [Achromobacter sp. R39]WMD18981.1 HlyD family efflux transporter periplasmic adaptor subunit [Achromobacter sp. R39]